MIYGTLALARKYAEEGRIEQWLQVFCGQMARIWHWLRDF